MPYKDPEKRRQKDRERRRRKRAEAMKKAGTGTQKKLSTPPEIRSAKDVREVVAEQVALVRSSKAEVIIKGRTIGYLAGVLLKAIEVSDLEERLTALEEFAEKPVKGDAYRQ